MVSRRWKRHARDRFNLRTGQAITVGKKRVFTRLDLDSLLRKPTWESEH